MAEEEFEEVQVSVDTKPEVDKDEEGGGDIPTPDDKEAGKLEILMSKQECFGHERGGGIVALFPMSAVPRLDLNLSTKDL